MDFKLASLPLSGLKPSSKQHGISLHQLSKWNSQLDMERLKTLHAQQDLKKQKKLAKQNSLQLKKQVHEIQQEAILLVSELQQEKTKNEQLLALVKNSQELIYQQKLQKYEDVMNKKEPDQFEQQKKILVEKQKKLEKILQKLNSSEFEISKKIDSIRALRRQRGIHSNVFDKLEKQYFDVEFYYKQLLMQRTVIEKQLEKQLTEFNLVYHQSNMEVSRIKENEEKSQRINQIQIQQKSENFPKIQIQSKKDHVTLRVPEINFSKQKDFHSTERSRSKHDLYQSKIWDQKNHDQVKKLDYKKKLKTVLNDLGCLSFNEVLKKEIRKNIEEEHSSFQKSNSMYQELFNTQNEIKRLETQLHERKNIRSNVISRKKVNLHSQISQFQIQAEQAKTQINSFKSDFQNLLKKCMAGEQSQRLSSSNHRSNIQKAMDSQDFTFSENQQLLKEMMAFFNDELLEGYLQGLRSGQGSKSRVYLDKSIVRRKHKKMSSIGFERKVRIQRTQTDNSNASSYSIRNSECLDAILNMHVSNLQKPEKGQKVDTLSIMTEQELIQQSKRLIRQINKKKSEFINIGSNKR